MGTYKNKTYPLRINDELKTKMKEIAKIGNRPVSREYETAIILYIEDYERQHGPIELPPAGEDSAGGGKLIKTAA